MRCMQLALLGIALLLAACQSSSVSSIAPSDLTDSQSIAPHIVQGGSGAKFIEAYDVACVDGLIAGPLTSIWFVDQCTDRVGRISMADETTTFSLHAPVAIAVGGDKNLWILTHDTLVQQTIVKMTPSGSMTPFKIPCASGSTVNQIGTGPDGNIWFTDSTAFLVGRMKLDGTSHCFPTAGSDTWGYQIGAGPDGNFWFLDGPPNMISKITPSGILTEYPDPQGCTTVLKAGDGNLYCGSPNGIFRVSTSDGTETLVAPQSANYLATSGTGGGARLYYSCPGDGRTICNSPPAAVYPRQTNYQLFTLRLANGLWKADSLPLDQPVARNVAVGPDGNLWYFWYSSPNRGGIGVDVLRDLSVSPTSVNIGVGQSQTIIAFERGRPTGPLNASTSNPAVATVSPGSGDTFIVTAQGIGSATIRIADSRHNFVRVSVAVH
jgi:streptogramin lyase